MGQPLPVSYLDIDIKNDYDYYRPMSIKYARDSVKFYEGWQYEYSSIFDGTLHSAWDESFNLLTNRTLQKLRFIIHNQDNTPLTIGEITVKGSVSELVARFTEPATYTILNNRCRQ